MRLTLAILTISLTFSSVSADGCTPIMEPPEAQHDGTYLDSDFCQPECLISLWIYEESNGMPGLQRADHVVDHTCGGIYPADSIVAAVYVATP